MGEPFLHPIVRPFHCRVDRRLGALAAAAAFAALAVTLLAVATRVPTPSAAQAAPAPQSQRLIPAAGGHRPAALAQAGDPSSPSGCRALVTDTVRAGAHRICDTNAVTVTVGVTCVQAVPVHVVFLVAKHLLMEDHLAEVKSAARDAVKSLKFITGTKAGVISLSVQAYSDLELTSDQGSVMGAIGGISLDSVNPFLQYYDWLGRGTQMIEEGRRSEVVPPIDVMVLYSTGCPTGFPDYCNRQKGSANKAQGSGITVIGVCNPRARPFGLPFVLPATHCNDIRDMASRGYYFDLGQSTKVGPAIQDLITKAGKLTVKKLTLVDSVAPQWRVLPGSARPTPNRVTAGTTQRWEAADLSSGAALTVTYGITAVATGRLDLRLPGAAVDFEDSLGRKWGPVPLPTRRIDVGVCLRETATPTATATPTDTPMPTDTSTPAATATWTATPTASATATSEPGRAYLPLAMKRVCKAGEQPKEIALVVDASNSMLDLSAGQPKLDAAKAAAKRFVSFLDLGRDSVAVIAFNADATIVLPLSHNRPAIEAAIEGVITASGTRLDRAISMAHHALGRDAFPPDVTDPRASASRTIIVLTDGLSDPETDIAALSAEVELLRTLGYHRYTIGLGDTIDEPLLRAIADPGGFHRAADASALAGIYEGLAGELPCPGGVVLGR